MMNEGAKSSRAKKSGVTRDLADLKRALALSTVVAVTDRKGDITYVNDEFCRLSKYSRDELIGQNHRVLNSGLHPAEFFRDLWRNISRGQTWRGNIRNKAKDGSFYWVSTTIVPFLDDNGKPYQYISIRHDITEQKKIAQDLSDHQELIEQTYDAIYTWKLDDGLIQWNKNAERLYGYTREEARGRQVYELLQTKYPGSFEEYLENLRKSGYWEGEIAQTTKDGRELIVESRQAIKNSDDEHPIVLETSRNITAAKEANERIRQQASLLEKTRDAIMVCDLNHRLIYWNPGAERAYGWSAGEVLGNDICDTICNGDQTVIEAAMHALETADEWHEETTTITKSGERITVISRWNLVRNEVELPDYYLVVNTDVTDLKKAERQLFRTQRLESIGTLAGGIAHDLNNALSPIMMAVEMLQNDLDLPEGSQAWLSIIRENTQRGADLIKQVLMFARGADEGTRIDLQTPILIKEFVKIIEKTFPQNVKIECRLATQLDHISADPTQIHQVLMNLAVNAKDALAEKGGSLQIEATNLQVERSQIKGAVESEPGPYILISVRDTGSGMSRETLARIWDPFFTTKEIGKGTGLGLSTALSIVEGHGGFIVAESKEGVGTEISVYLPALRVHARESGAPSAKSPQGHGETILFVDDEPHVLLLAKATLEKHGYKVITASSGQRAIEAIKTNNTIDLLLTDMAMPEMDGPATISAIREIDPEIRVIASSGLVQDYRSHLGSINADSFLEKPFTIEALLSVISKTLAKSV